MEAAALGLGPKLPDLSKGDKEEEEEEKRGGEPCLPKADREMTLRT